MNRTGLAFGIGASLIFAAGPANAARQLRGGSRRAAAEARHGCRSDRGPSALCQADCTAEAVAGILNFIHTNHQSESIPWRTLARSFGS
jgi:hypothetical protein